MPQPEPSSLHRRLIVHEGHTSGVLSVAFAPNGKSVASGSGDKSIRIWDAQHPSSIGQPLKGHTGTIYSISYSPLGTVIASGSYDRTIRLWDIATAQQIGAPLKGHGGDVNSVAFSRDGRLLASGSDDKTIRLWDTQDRSSASFRGHTDWVRSVAFSPDGTRIVSGSNDKTIRIWDLERRTTIVGPLDGHTNTVRSVAFSTDGYQIVAGSNDNTVSLWDSRAGRIIGKPYEGHTSDVHSAAFSSNGIHVVSGSRDHTARVWDVRVGRQVDEPFSKHTDSVNSVAFSPCSTYIVSGSADQTAVIWNAPGISSVEDNESQTAARNNSNNERFEFEYSTVSIGQHTSIHETFNSLLRNGCVDLTSQLDTKLDAAVLMLRKSCGDAWEGQLRNGVRVQTMTWRESLIEECHKETLERAVKDIQSWSRLRHKNIHKLMGVAMPGGQYLALIMERMEYSNLHEYMRKNPEFDRHNLCMQITLGLAYIHQSNIVHGDLESRNILVSSNGVAKISSFGLPAMSEACLPLSKSLALQTGSIRWAAPELVAEGAPKTKETDVYSLGMTILEMISGNLPYPQCRWDFQVLSKVIQKETPCRPPELKDDEYGNQMWGLMLSCWNENPRSRPPSKDLFGSLALISQD